MAAGRAKGKEPEGEREEALKRALGQIEKQYGPGTIMSLGAGTVLDIPGISTGSISLDLALGGRGIPRGRITEIFGPEASGKTTLCLHIIANAQRAGGIAAFIDAEHALDTTWARTAGVNLDSMLVSQPDSGEQALEITEMLVRSGAVDVIVVDSVAALVPQAELEGRMGEQQVALQARLMSQALRKLAGAINKSHTAVVFVNQIRMRIGIMFGNPETTPGGRALRHHAAVRLDVRRTGAITVGEETVGSRVRALVVKNKVAPPYRKAEFDILYDRGVNYWGDLLDLAVAEGLVTRSGAWYRYGETQIGQGRDAACEFLSRNADIAQVLEDAILTARGVPLRPRKVAPAAPPAADA
jgi:recombination protein RecA